MWSGKTHTHIWKLTYWSTWQHGMCSTWHHPAYVGCLSNLNFNELATAGRKIRKDIWVNFTFDVKTNKTLCKPCGAEIAGKNTTNLKRHLQGNHPEIHAKLSTKFLLILFCQLTSVGVLLQNWNIIAQGFSKSGLRSGSGGNSIRTRLHLIFQAHSYHSDLRSAHTHTHTRAHEPVLQCLQTLL